MTYSIITPADNADFFAQFKTFVVSVGWTIDAQSDSELYIHNGSGKYLGFRLGTIVFNQYYTGVFFTCAINNSYDSTKDWFNQPGSSINNLDPNYLPVYNTTVCTKYLSCIYLANDITKAIFVADAQNIIVNIKRGSYRHDTIIVTSISKKAYSFADGDIINSTQILRAYSNGWIVDFNQTMNIFPFNAAVKNVYTAVGGVSLKKDGKYTTSSGLGTNQLFLTNTMETSSVDSLRNLIPFKYYPEGMYLLESSMYTGLIPMVVPEFFLFKDNSIVYLGSVEKIKIVNSANLVPEQILEYGGKKYIILNFLRGNLNSPNVDLYFAKSYLAIEVL